MVLPWDFVVHLFIKIISRCIYTFSYCDSHNFSILNLNYYNYMLTIPILLLKYYIVLLSLFSLTILFPPIPSFPYILNIFTIPFSIHSTFTFIHTYTLFLFIFSPITTYLLINFHVNFTILGKYYFHWFFL